RRTLSEIESSEICLSAARQTPTISSRAAKAANNLTFIFTGHCTPVERVEEGSLLPPSRLHAHVQVEIDLRAEKLFHLFPRQRADTLQHRAFRADHDGLLPV